jgi:hypothetical protein
MHSTIGEHGGILASEFDILFGHFNIVEEPEYN